MAMYEITFVLEGFNAQGFRVQKPAIEMNVSREVAQNKQSQDVETTPNLPQEEVDQLATDDDQ